MTKFYGPWLTAHMDYDEFWTVAFGACQFYPKTPYQRALRSEVLNRIADLNAVDKSNGLTDGKERFWDVRCHVCHIPCEEDRCPCCTTKINLSNYEEEFRKLVREDNRREEERVLKEREEKRAAIRRLGCVPDVSTAPDTGGQGWFQDLEDLHDNHFKGLHGI